MEQRAYEKQLSIIIPVYNTAQYLRECLNSVVGQTVEGMEEVTGNKYNVVNIVGGGIKDKMICQFTANATKRVVSTGPVEATSIGNVLVQAIAMGAIKDINEGRKVVKNSFDISTYEPQDSEAWDRAYEEWKEIIKKA